MQNMCVYFFVGCIEVAEWGLRLCEVVGDEVGAFEEQENITEAVTLQGTV